MDPSPSSDCVVEVALHGVVGVGRHKREFRIYGKQVRNWTDIVTGLELLIRLIIKDFLITKFWTPGLPEGSLVIALVHLSLNISETVHFFS